MPFSSNSSNFNSSNFTPDFLKAAWHANPGAARNFAGSNLWIFINVFLKFSKTSAKSNTSVLR